MLWRNFRGRKVKLLVSIVLGLAAVTWITLFWNYKYSRSPLKQKNTHVHNDGRDYFQIDKFNMNKVEFGSAVSTRFSSATAETTRQGSSAINLVTRDEIEVKHDLSRGSKRSCKLDWNFPYINISSYENNPAKLPKQTSNTTDVRPVFPSPTLYLRPDKFLYPVGRWGPNNQLFGFFEAIFVAVVLNRTFVLPRFLKHHLDKQSHSTEFTSPSHYVDVEYYCKFISCITLESFQKACGFEIDAIMNTKYMKTYHFDDIKRHLGMRFPSGLSDMSELLLPPNGTSEEKKELTFTPSELQMYFKTQAKCVVYPYPILDLRTYNARGKRVKLHSSKPSKPFYKARNLSLPAGVDLFESILNHYRRPLFIRQIVEHFHHSVIEGNPFLSIHWRYNEGDFLSKHHCNNQDINKKICSRAKSFTSEDFIQKIDEKLEEIEKKGFKMTHVYFAAPPDALKMMKQLSKLLRKNRGIDIFSSKELIQFLKSEYNNCEFLTKHFDDIISTTEMEICSRGFAFLGSQGTTWTSNVIKSRLFGNITGIRTEFDDLVFESKLKK
uniref:uncharacterized protein LOC120338145 n=1 Tax=Styela clava TaxID=7725 RepID=UPI001939AC77|nr:uncharacterized protein LOC120338145 [Styela clava]